MTHRLYYTNPYERSFDATVVRVDRRAARHGGRTAVFLDRTAFYPTSGGQPFDTGMLAGVRVVEVVDEEDGTIAHVIDEPGGAPGALAAGQAASGEIDWDRRFDHMQQHTGQHVLSAAFARLFDARTVSFHLGAEVSTIDLAREMTPGQIAAAAAEANRIVWEDRPVGVRFASKEEAAAMPLRKESRRDGTLRLIDIESWDLSACGGTHVARTGGIGIVAVAGWERFKGGQRLEFVCGGRALRRFESMRDALGAGTRLLSVGPLELPGTIERMLAEAKDQKRAVDALQADVARFRAEQFAAGAEAGPSGRLVLRAVEADAPGLKAIANAIVARPGFIVVLVSASTPALLVAARSADLPAFSAQDLVRSIVTAFGGRGGGKPDFAQGGGLDAAPGAILDAARALLPARSASSA